MSRQYSEPEISALPAENMRERYDRKDGEFIMASEILDTVAQVCQLIDLVSDTMDDYLYICDFQNDFFYISPHAKERSLFTRMICRN